MSKAFLVLLFLVGLINFLPVLGALSAERLAQAYSIEVVGSDLEILLRHRALLFGIVGGFILVSVFIPVYQGAAMIIGAVSMVGFLVLALQVGDYNAALQKVLWVDVGGIVLLAAAAVLKVFFKA